MGLIGSVFVLKRPSTGQVVNYMMMPGIWPRIKELLFGGFGIVSYQIAVIFLMVRILPPQHPFFVPANASRYGILDVFREASAHLKFSKAHIDQIIIYFCLLGGLLLIGFFFLSLIVMLLSAPAFAGVNYSIVNNVFLTPNPTEDIAFRLLDRVFGVPGIFNSKDLNPTAFHVAFQGLLKYYSTLMIFIAAIVVFYYAAVVVGETTMYGTPFGKRFDTVWAPLRLVVAIGLLIPLSNGLNSGQYITLYAAKFGSSFGTNLWLKYNDTIKASLGADATPLGYKPEDLIITPDPQGIGTLMEFIHTAGLCNVLYRQEKKQNIDVFLVDEKDVVRITTAGMNSTGLNAFLKKLGRKSDPRFVFGDQDITKYGSQYKHGIRPLCGELAVPFNTGGNALVVKLQASILGMVVGITSSTSFGTYSNNMISNNYPDADRTFQPPLDAIYARTLISELETFLAGALPAFVNAYGAQNPLDIVKDVRDLGWAGAGVWYNRLAEINGPIVAAQFNIAYPVTYPIVMEEVAKQVAKINPSIKGVDRFNPQPGGKTPININIEGVYDPGLGIAKTLNASYQYWYNNGAIENQQTTANVILDYLSALFGVKALFEMRENAHLHPMVSLIGLGKAMIEKSIRHMMIATGAAAMGGLVSIMDPQRFGPIITAFSGLFVSFAMIGLVAGVTLFYIVPFLPFLFVFFAAGTWVKSIFEAMVGVPLWALAHLRIDGPGLPAHGARQGYLLIFDIFLRPVLIIFGLVASLAIFSGLVFVLNDIFDLVTSNLTGFQDTKKSGTINWTSVQSVRGPIDQFAFTLIYVILVYMIAMSSFKLIDFFPKTVYRWFGGSIQSFAAMIKDDFDERQLMQYSSAAVGLGSQSVGGMGQRLGGAFGQGIGGMFIPKGFGGSTMGALGLAGTLGGIWATTSQGGILSPYGPGEMSGPNSIEATFNKAPVKDLVDRIIASADNMPMDARLSALENRIKDGTATQAEIAGLLEDVKKTSTPEKEAEIRKRIEQLQAEVGK